VSHQTKQQVKQLHYDFAGSLGPAASAQRITDVFGQAIANAIRTQLIDLQANFADPDAQGTVAYVSQITLDHPELDQEVAAADAQLAVAAFTEDLLRRGATH